MKQIGSPPCARQMKPMRERAVQIGIINLDIKEKRHRERLGSQLVHEVITMASQTLTTPFRHQHGSTEVDAVAASLECND